jgi:hypothetical protein
MFGWEKRRSEKAGGVVPLNQAIFSNRCLKKFLSRRMAIILVNNILEIYPLS